MLVGVSGGLCLMQPHRLVFLNTWLLPSATGGGDTQGLCQCQEREHTDRATQMLPAATGAKELLQQVRMIMSRPSEEFGLSHGTSEFASTALQN